MKALVTGANGFIGSHLCELLVAGGHDVRAFVRRTGDLRWLDGLKLDYAYGDLRDPGSLAAAASGIETVFHLGATVRAKDPADFERVNREGTRLIAEACIARGVQRFVLFSSAAAAGPAESPDKPSLEGHEPNPVSLYGKGKLGAEQVLLNIKEKLHSVILRFPAVYGPRDRDILKMMQAMKRLRIMPVFGGTFSTVHVLDAARAALLAAECTVPSGSVYFVSDGNCYTYDHVVDIVDHTLGIRPLRLRIPAWLIRAAGWVSESLSRDGSIFNRDKAKELSQSCWVCAPDKARAELGYQPEYNLERGMGETIKWYQEQGWL